MLDICNEYGMMLDANKPMRGQIGDCGWNAPVNLMLDGRELHWGKETKILRGYYFS